MIQANKSASITIIGESRAETKKNTGREAASASPHLRSFLLAASEEPIRRAVTRLRYFRRST
jgi:hypothetical protein